MSQRFFEVRVYRNASGQALVLGHSEVGFADVVKLLGEHDQAWEGPLTLELCFPTCKNDAYRLVAALGRHFDAVRPRRGTSCDLLAVNVNTAQRVVASSWRRLVAALEVSGVKPQGLFRFHSTGTLLAGEWLIAGCNDCGDCTGG